MTQCSMIYPSYQEECLELRLWTFGLVESFNLDEILPLMYTYLLFNIEMYETRDVTQWRQDFRDIDLDTPNIMLTFAGIFGHLMLLEWDYNTTLSIANPLLGLRTF